MKIPKSLGRIGMRLAAIFLAMILISPGVLWGQGSGGKVRAQGGSQQTDKTSLQAQQKKQQQLKNRTKQSQSSQKGKKPSTRTRRPPEQPLRGGPMGPNK